MEDLAELERRLVSDPFDDETRRRYAAALTEAAQHEDALTQWRLLVRQHPGEAELHVSVAFCSKALADDDAAAEALASARGCADYDEDDPRLAALLSDDEARPPAEPETEQPAPLLRAVDGGRTDSPGAEVVSISATDTVRFADIVGMDELKKVVRLRIIEPFLRPGLFQRFKRKAGGGVLLYGPPGCGKTMLARAVATECDASFTPIGISDILNLWIGESERNLAQVFQKAREEVPSVLFFDELDALAYSRSKSHSDHMRTMVNEFLSQLDGVSSRNEHVLILAATNMPWDVDDAMKRPGRFDRQVFVPPPDALARAEMLRAKLRDVPTDPFDADRLAARCKHFSGADMDGLIDRAKDRVLDEILGGGVERNLSETDLDASVEEVEPSTLEWLKTARNLVKFGGRSGAYKDVEKYLRGEQLY